MRIDTAAHQARIKRLTDAASMSITDLDPETATLDQCRAALRIMFTKHPHCSALGFRSPALYEKADGTILLTITSEGRSAGAHEALSTPSSAFHVGKCEGAFMGELLASIPKEERPLCGNEQCVTSVKAMATAIKTMAKNNEWEFSLLKTSLSRA